MISHRINSDNYIDKLRSLANKIKEERQKNSEIIKNLDTTIANKFEKNFSRMADIKQEYFKENLKQKELKLNESKTIFEKSSKEYLKEFDESFKLLKHDLMEFLETLIEWKSHKMRLENGLSHIDKKSNTFFENNIIRLQETSKIIDEMILRLENVLNLQNLDFSNLELKLSEKEKFEKSFTLILGYHNHIDKIIDSIKSVIKKLNIIFYGNNNKESSSKDNLKPLVKIMNEVSEIVPELKDLDIEYYVKFLSRKNEKIKFKMRLFVNNNIEKLNKIIEESINEFITIEKETIQKEFFKFKELSYPKKVLDEFYIGNIIDYFDNKIFLINHYLEILGKKYSYNNFKLVFSDSLYQNLKVHKKDVIETKSKLLKEVINIILKNALFEISDNLKKNNIMNFDEFFKSIKKGLSNIDYDLSRLFIKHSKEFSEKQYYEFFTNDFINNYLNDLKQYIKKLYENEKKEYYNTIEMYEKELKNIVDEFLEKANAKNVNKLFNKFMYDYMTIINSIMALEKEINEKFELYRNELYELNNLIFKFFNKTINFNFDEIRFNDEIKRLNKISSKTLPTLKKYNVELYENEKKEFYNTIDKYEEELRNKVDEFTAKVNAKNVTSLFKKFMNNHISTIDSINNLRDEINKRFERYNLELQNINEKIYEFFKEKVNFKFNKINFNGEIERLNNISSKSLPSFKNYIKELYKVEKKEYYNTIEIYEKELKNKVDEFLANANAQNINSLIKRFMNKHASIIDSVKSLRNDINKRFERYNLELQKINEQTYEFFKDKVNFKFDEINFNGEIEKLNKISSKVLPTFQKYIKKLYENEKKEYHDTIDKYEEELKNKVNEFLTNVNIENLRDTLKKLINDYESTNHMVKVLENKINKNFQAYNFELQNINKKTFEFFGKTIEFKFNEVNYDDRISKLNDIFSTIYPTLKEYTKEINKKCENELYQLKSKYENILKKLREDYEIEELDDKELIILIKKTRTYVELFRIEKRKKIEEQLRSFSGKLKKYININKDKLNSIDLDYDLIRYFYGVIDKKLELLEKSILGEMNNLKLKNTKEIEYIKKELIEKFEKEYSKYSKVFDSNYLKYNIENFYNNISKKLEKLINEKFEDIQSSTSHNQLEKLIELNRIYNGMLNLIDKGKIKILSGGYLKSKVEEFTSTTLKKYSNSYKNNIYELIDYYTLIRLNLEKFNNNYFYNAMSKLSNSLGYIILKEIASLTDDDNVSAKEFRNIINYKNFTFKLSEDQKIDLKIPGNIKSIEKIKILKSCKLNSNYKLNFDKDFLINLVLNNYKEFVNIDKFYDFLNETVGKDFIAYVLEGNIDSLNNKYDLYIYYLKKYLKNTEISEYNSYDKLYDIFSNINIGVFKYAINSKELPQDLKIKILKALLKELDIENSNQVLKVKYIINNFLLPKYLDSNEISDNKFYSIFSNVPNKVFEKIIDSSEFSDDLKLNILNVLLKRFDTKNDNQVFKVAYVINNFLLPKYLHSRNLKFFNIFFNISENIFKEIIDSSEFSDELKIEILKTFSKQFDKENKKLVSKMLYIINKFIYSSYFIDNKISEYKLYSIFLNIPIEVFKEFIDYEEQNYSGAKMNTELKIEVLKIFSKKFNKENKEELFSRLLYTMNHFILPKYLKNKKLFKDKLDSIFLVIPMEVFKEFIYSNKLSDDSKIEILNVFLRNFNKENKELVSKLLYMIDEYLLSTPLNDAVLIKLDLDSINSAIINEIHRYIEQSSKSKFEAWNKIRKFKKLIKRYKKIKESY